MSRSVSLAGLLASLLVFSLAPTASAEDQGETYVVPPNNEKLFSEMLCGAPALPEGCACKGVKIDHSVVVATYACGDRPEAVIELRHPASAPPNAVKTASFGLIRRDPVPDALFSAVEARVKAKEGGWKWVTAGAGQPRNDQEGVGPTPSISQQIPEGVDRAEWADYKAGVALYSQGRHEEALAAMIKLARARPQPMAGVLGMAVASLASTSPTPDVVARYVAEAERDRKDTVNQFLAGVAAHYCGHRQATTKAEKVQLYTTSLEYLNRTLPQYEQEPRVHIYLGVSYFRLGQQEAAEKHINRAVALGSNDADSYYCRAEVYHRKDPAKAIADIEKYLQISEEMSRREGSSLSKDKQQRVREMLAALRAVTPGQQPPDGLWDPLRVATFDLSNKLSPRFFAAATLSVGALAGVAWLLVSRAARRRTGKSPAA